MNNFNELKRQDQEAYLMYPIIRELRRLGGEATTKELKRMVVRNDSLIPEDTLTLTKKSQKGHVYHPFNFPFNFAVTNLVMAGYLHRPRTGTVILTSKGRSFEESAESLIKDVYKISLPIWKERSKKNRNHTADRVKIADEEADKSENWRIELLHALLKLKPSKFEIFCRALVKKMNVDIDESLGIQLSGDGGIDGYGYMTTADFRTTRVSIQAKRWGETNLVSSPEIDKFRAEYGIFITTSSFIRDTIRASRNGTRVITLIDGDHLVDLVAKYQLYVKPVITYELEEFFTDNH